MLAAIESFLGGLRDDAAEPNLILTTVLEATCRRPSTRVAALGARALPRPAARRAARPDARELRRPGPRGALRERAGRLVPPAARGRAHGRVRAARRAPDRPGAGDRRAASRAPRRAGRDPRHLDRADLVAGSGIEFSERGAVELPLAGTSREWRLFSVER